MKCSWQEGNRIRLLENGDNYYPALFAAIGRAQQRVILESFIWFEDDVGKQLHAVLLKAAQRGVRVGITGRLRLAGFKRKLCGELTSAGVIFATTTRARDCSVCAPICFAACIVKSW